MKNLLWGVTALGHLVFTLPAQAALLDLSWTGTGEKLVTAGNPADPINALLPKGVTSGTFFNPAAGQFSFSLSMVVSTAPYTGAGKFRADGGFAPQSTCQPNLAFACTSLALPQVGTAILSITDSTGRHFSASVTGGFAINDTPGFMPDTLFSACTILGVGDFQGAAGAVPNCSWLPPAGAIATSTQPHTLTQAQFEASNDPWAYLLDGYDSRVQIGGPIDGFSVMDGKLILRAEPATVPEADGVGLALAPLAVVLGARRRRVN